MSVHNGYDRNTKVRYHDQMSRYQYIKVPWHQCTPVPRYTGTKAIRYQGMPCRRSGEQFLTDPSRRLGSGGQPAWPCHSPYQAPAAGYFTIRYKLSRIVYTVFYSLYRDPCLLYRPFILHLRQSRDQSDPLCSGTLLPRLRPSLDPSLYFTQVTYRTEPYGTVRLYRGVWT